MKRSLRTRAAVTLVATFWARAAVGGPRAVIQAMQDTAPCVPDATTLCFDSNRFRATAAWVSAAQSGQGQAIALTSDTGYFWFFSSANVEMITKVLDACAINSSFWVFAGGLTNVQVIITVTDTQTGTQRTYLNPAGTAFQPIQDTSVFACNGGSPSGLDLTGTWTATVSSPDGCNDSFNVVFSQVGNNVTGNFSIPMKSGAISGTFIENVAGDSVQGVFTETLPVIGCSGSGTFTGSGDSHLFTISVPTVTSANPNCHFCEQNTITLQR
jgi:hypothetical protein